MFDDLIDPKLNEYTKSLSEDDQDFGLLDTGSYLLNGQQSGSIWGGFPERQITTIAGAKATGKTFILRKIVKLFLKKHENGRVIYFESEFAVKQEDFEALGFTKDQIRVQHVRTIENFHTEAYDLLKRYRAMSWKTKGPLLTCLDSFGNMSTDKEVGDVEKGEDKVDMTKAKQAKRLFRTMTLEMGVGHVPLIATNHTYKEIGAMNPKYAKTIMTGGEALYYNSSSIIFLSKRKDKDDDTDDVVGARIICKNEKCRDAKENTETELRISYNHGLSRYHGLLEFGEENGVFEKLKNGQFRFGNGKPSGAKAVYANPQQFFTQEVLERLDEACKLKFRYGQDTVSGEDF